MQGVAKYTQAHIVVLLIHGGPLDVSWLQQSDRVGAILTSWYPGQVSRRPLTAAKAPAILGSENNLPVLLSYGNMSWTRRTQLHDKGGALHIAGREWNCKPAVWRHLPLRPVASVRCVQQLHGAD